MVGSVGGFDFSNDSDSELDPDMGSIPEADTPFDIDAFERAASEQPEAASPTQSAPKSRKKKSVPAPEQKKIPYHASYKDVPPNKYIESYSDAQKWIDAIENYEGNVVGGSNAFYSGDKTELTDSAKKVVKRLENFMAKFDFEDDEGEDELNKKKKRTPKASKSKQNVEEYIPEKKGPLASYSPGATFGPSPSGSGSGLPPTQPPAPPSPPDDYSDYPQGEYPEDPNNKPDIINQISSVPTDKDIKKAQDENLATVKKAFKDFIREEKDKFAREFRDEKLSLNREVQKLNAEAISRKTEINRASSDAKTAIYSLSAGIGLPGYVIASVADSLIIQPAVRQDVKAEQQYQRELQDYKNQEVDILNARKDAFREYIKSNEYSSLPQDVKDSYAETGEIPEGALPSFEQWADRTGASSAFKGKNIPLPIQPVGKAAAVTGAISQAGPVVAGAVEGIQLVNKTVASVGESTRKNISSSLTKDGISGISNKTQSFAGILDPTETNPAINLFKEATKTFEYAVKDFEKVAREDLAFSPGALQADVEGSIMRLEQSMRIAQQIDPQKEGMIRVTDELNLIWNEFRTLFFGTFAPVIIFLLNGLKLLLQSLLDVVKFIKTIIVTILDILISIASYMPGMQVTAYAARSILNHLTKTNTAPTVLQQTLDDFHNPNNRPIQPPRPGNFR
jgi:hypothetical protein